jgi:hypothetical protein
MANSCAKDSFYHATPGIGLSQEKSSFWRLLHETGRRRLLRLDRWKTASNTTHVSTAAVRFMTLDSGAQGCPFS